MESDVSVKLTSWIKIIHSQTREIISVCTNSCSGRQKGDLFFQMKELLNQQAFLTAFQVECTVTGTKTFSMPQKERLRNKTKRNVDTFYICIIQS
jgi:hypothetical protein